MVSVNAFELCIDHVPIFSMFLPPTLQFMLRNIRVDQTCNVQLCGLALPKHATAVAFAAQPMLQWLVHCGQQCHLALHKFIRAVFHVVTSRCCVLYVQMLWLIVVCFEATLMFDIS
jgi:hypothetical protein